MTSSCFANTCAYNEDGQCTAGEKRELRSALPFENYYEVLLKDSSDNIYEADEVAVFLCVGYKTKRPGGASGD